MTLREIEQLPVRDLAAPDSVLVLWLTQAMVPHGLRVMEAWGFTYKTMGAWAKQSRTGRSWAFGTGYLLRSAAEFFAVGTRGSLPSRARDVRNLIVAPVAEHSRKPEALHIALERMYPEVPKLELFARQRRGGWDSWGHQT